MSSVPNGERGHGGLGEFRVPDGINPIRGYRKFGLSPDGWLRGVSFPQRWLPGINEAHCHLARPVKGVVPPPQSRSIRFHGWGGGLGVRADENGDLVLAEGFERAACPGVARDNHGCGFYARHGGKLQYHMYGYDFTVSGVVDMWGQVELGPDGVRAQFARIVALKAYEIRETTQRGIDRHAELLAAAEKELAEAEEGDDWPALAARVDKERDQVTLLSSGPGRWETAATRYAEIPVFQSDDEMLEAFPVPDLTKLVLEHEEES